ncbi:hypothetical protein F5884DRAFT_881689, partial [Xylogone sp. PMI_703]
NVRIQFDNPPSFYTNLDFITGKVILVLTKDENVGGIHVKLEGESTTRLLRPYQRYPGQVDPRANQRQTIVLENHKILYRVQQVFPKGPAIGASFTLGAGRHEYPFKFKIPINSGCWDPNSQQMGPGSGFGGLGLAGLQQMQYRHVKKTLPPSLTGFPGEAEIRYYVKVTVQRPSLFKENRRAAIGFKFLPIEPPRPPPTTNEVYARRPFSFQAGLAGYARKSSLFKKAAPPLSNTAPKGEIDARLPSPAILTCHEAIPLRILVKKLNESPEQIFLMSLQISLFGYTEVRAFDVTRTEANTWVLASVSDLAIPVGTPDDKIDTETIVDDMIWRNIVLPNTVAPSFNTCNLTRRYELEVQVGLGYGIPGHIQAIPQIITLPLRFQLSIYSGIRPPAALIDAMAGRPPQPARPSAAQPPSTGPKPTYDPLYPPQVGTAGAPGLDDAPPSYEDAIAEDITVADGPRREYSGVTDENAPTIDEKASGLPSYSARPGGQNQR